MKKSSVKRKSPKTKLCVKCGDMKLLAEMALNTFSKDGKSNWCGQCLANHINYYNERQETRSIKAQLGIRFRNFPKKLISPLVEPIISVVKIQRTLRRTINKK